MKNILSRLLALPLLELVGVGTRSLQADEINLGTPRTAHAATLPNSEKVLITGGGNKDGILKSAQRYDRCRFRTKVTQ